MTDPAHAAATGTTSARLERPHQILISPAQAALLRELVHKAVWTGDVVTTIAPIVEQLETISPAPRPPAKAA